MAKKTLLQKVRERLLPMKGAQLVELYESTGISYDTLLRIRDERNDPGFSKVQKLAEHLGVWRP